MDHRWDGSLRGQRAGQVEHDRLQGPTLDANDVREVERRDRLREEEARRSKNRSPWQIGHDHWNQRDLYTRNGRTDDAGYARGPSDHPEVGSYAYPRDAHDRRIVGSHVPAAQSGRASRRYEAIYTREAWPHPIDDTRAARARDSREDSDAAYDGPEHEGVFGRVREMKERFVDAFMRASSPPPGPKNHNLDDARIREDVCDALTWRGDLDAGDIEVSVSDGEVTLEGTVRDRWSKRIAEETAEGCRGVTDVHNRLKLRPDDTDDADVAFVMPLQPV